MLKNINNDTLDMQVINAKVILFLHSSLVSKYRTIHVIIATSKRNVFHFDSSSYKLNFL